MRLLDTLGKGFRFFLMSMGVSTYAKKTGPRRTPPAPPAKPQ